MTPPLAGDQTSYAPASFSLAPGATGGARGSRAKVRSSLAWGRFRRGVSRQTLLVAIITALGLGLGAAYAYSTRQPYVFALAGFGAGGLGFALLAGLLREIGRNTIGALSAVRRHSGYSVIGAAPSLTPDLLKSLAPDQRTPLGCLTYQPASPFAAAFRDLQDVIAANQLVAFIGSAPNDGATTTALCAAISAAQQGRRVIVLDCDLRRRSLTRLLGREPEGGILQVAEQPELWQEAIEHEEETGLPFIPAARLRNPWRHLFSSPGFRALLDTLRAHYDLIVLDCPPALSSADGAMVARMADRCVIVTAWDDTPLSALRATMRMLRPGAPVLTGVYVNRVPSHYRFEPARVR